MPREVDIINYLPPILQTYTEYEAIAEAINPELNLLWEALKDAENDQFIESSTENGVKRREKMLKIIPKDTDTLEDRKFRLSARELEKLPYTYRVLERKLKSLCGEKGYILSVNYNNFIVMVRVDLTSKKAYEEVELLLDKMVPENMIIDLSLLYNPNSILSGFTHKQLSEYTHKQLREEVLNNE